MRPLPLLILQSAHAGLIQVNGKNAGETGEGASVCVPVASTGSYYITMIPLSGDSKSIVFPVTKKILFADGVPSVGNDGHIVAWPGNMYQLSLEPGTLQTATTEFPFTVASIDWPLEARFTATLFFDGALCLVIEDASGKMVFGHTLTARAREGSLRLLKVGGQSLLAASGPCAEGEYLVCVKHGAGFDLALEMQSGAFFFDKTDAQFTAIQRMPTCRLHEQLSQYTWDGAEWALTSEDPPAPTRPVQTPQDLVHAFAEALQFGLNAEATGYLSRSLADGLDFDTLNAFIGPFSHHLLPDFVSSPIDGEVVLGLYTKEPPVSQGRMFALAVEKEIGWHIGNIREW